MLHTIHLVCQTHTSTLNHYIKLKNLSKTYSDTKNGIKPNESIKICTDRVDRVTKSICSDGHGRPLPSWLCCKYSKDITRYCPHPTHMVIFKCLPIGSGKVNLALYNSEDWMVRRTTVFHRVKPYKGPDNGNSLAFQCDIFLYKND